MTFWARHVAQSSFREEPISHVTSKQRSLRPPGAVMRAAGADTDPFHHSASLANFTTLSNADAHLVLARRLRLPMRIICALRRDDATACWSTSAIRCCLVAHWATNRRVSDAGSMQCKFQNVAMPRVGGSSLAVELCPYDSLDDAPGRREGSWRV